MELIERDHFLASLQSLFHQVSRGEGHSVFINGEAGIGKTSLVKEFCRQQQHCSIFEGTCDALFTPRPLAPLFDIAAQLNSDLLNESAHITDRVPLFARLFQELKSHNEIIIIVFEDVHWADEATLDFVKFLARRISQMRCLFIVTYRDDEIHSRHPFRNVLGQLAPHTFTRIQLTPLSRQAVEKMAGEKGYSGEDVYSISGGNPFFVSEILASYSFGVPDNIKDSVLSVFNSVPDNTKEAWKILSMMPTGLELDYSEKIETSFTGALENCMAKKILLVQDGKLLFKHELYRRTVAESLSPLVRMALNKRILDLFRENFASKNEIERIIHHAKNANEYDIIVHYAPIAAKEAAAVGAHYEAAKLYFTAIEYYQGNDKDKLIGFYEGYSYECYLTNQVKEAIIYQGKCLAIYKERNDIERTGSSLRFLARLWWFGGSRTRALDYAKQATEVLEDQPISKAKAMAYSNMSQLQMLADFNDDSLYWGEKAIAMARELQDDEILAHALNNVGTVLLKRLSTKEQGMVMLEQSLSLALKNSYHEHAARAYTNLGATLVLQKDYSQGKKVLDEGIQYCEARDLELWTVHKLIWKARLLFETGNWNEAEQIAAQLMENEQQSPIVKVGALSILARIKLRKGENDVIPLLKEAIRLSLEIAEPLRIIPAMVASMEYECLTGTPIIEEVDMEKALEFVKQDNSHYDVSEFYFWLNRSRKMKPVKEIFEGFITENEVAARKAAASWKQIGCPYEEAVVLFEGNEDDKREAISLIHGLGANAIYEKMKLLMKSSGIKSIPRGLRKSTMANAALLTERELDVLRLLQGGMQNKDIASKLFISAKTVDHHISSILFKLDVNSRVKAVQEALRQGILK